MQNMKKKEKIQQFLFLEQYFMEGNNHLVHTPN